MRIIGLLRKGELSGEKFKESFLVKIMIILIIPNSNVNHVQKKRLAIEKMLFFTGCAETVFIHFIDGIFVKFLQRVLQENCFARFQFVQSWQENATICNHIGVK